MLGITSAFSSLGINECNPPPPQKHASLPNLLTDRPSIFDEEPSDHPIDFSKKYGETPMYAETDLDQPTNYSLRYAEDDEDPKTKTYCTEDTPYETPFTFSTSTSMSDLRPPTKKPQKSAFSSGLMSPEKPVNYCDEGTPGYFSRVDSCSSLNCQKNEPKDNQQKVKVVKFEPNVNYVEETPLMFSRSSSLASLDSIEGGSIHDDRSSVVSDFSRLTSGGISPSELPDSPSQTVPPSPKPAIVFQPQQKTNNEQSVFGDAVKNFKMESTPLHFSTATSLSSLVDEIKDGDQLKKEELSDNEGDDDILAECINIGMKNNRYSLTKPDMTSDSIRTYYTEDTPAILSHAGSQSDLSILSMVNDVEKNENEEERKPDETTEASVSDLERNQPETSTTTQILADVTVTENSPSHHSSFSSLSDVTDEAEEALLQECILAGMPTQKPEKTETDDEDGDILANCINIGIKNNKYSQKRGERGFGDSVKKYCTEDTPAILSHAGSCSDISGLDLGGDSSDDEGLLAECVRVGMAKIAGEEPNESDINTSLEENPSDTSSIASSTSSSEEALLQQCILAGMPKPPPASASSNLTPSEKQLLQQIIVEGMKKCQNTSPKQPPNELTEAEHALLRQCILSGMPKNKNLTMGGPSARRESTELTENERLLLQQCIMAGMPKGKPKSRRGPGGEHTCCVHCPKNKNKTRRKYKERDKIQMTETRDVLFVTSQILTVERSHEEWV